MLSGSSPGREQRSIVLSSTQSLVNCAGLSSPFNGLDVLPLAESGLRYNPTLMEPRQVLTYDQSDVESIIAEFCQLEKSMRVAEEDSEVLCVDCAPAN